MLAFNALCRHAVLNAFVGECNLILFDGKVEIHQSYVLAHPEYKKKLYFFSYSGYARTYL